MSANATGTPTTNYSLPTFNTSVDNPNGLGVNEMMAAIDGIMAGASGSAPLLTTTGDILYASAAKTPARLGIGSTGNVLTVSGGLPVWSPAASGDPTPGTSFPGSPTTGQIYIYAADATNGVYWRFVYQGTYWAFVGGPPLYAIVTADEGTTSTSYTNLSTSGPALTLPFAGDFDVEIGADTYINAVLNSAFMSYAIGSTTASDSDGILMSTNNGGTVVFNDNITNSRRKRQTGLSAVTLTAKYKITNSGTANFQNRWMAVWPVKK